MSWLHTWSGLTMGWVVYVVFVAGSLSFFRGEITAWMQPELQAARPDRGAGLDRAVALLTAAAPKTSEWSIALPGPRSAVYVLSWRDGRPSANRGMEPGTGEKARAGRGPGPETGAADGPRAHHQIIMDPATGAVLTPRRTAGGNFIYDLHFQLYGMPPLMGKWIIGIATMGMFVALISGIIIHRNIFKDFFTFRPGKGKRSWMDGHNVVGVAALPLHLILTFSGLLLLGVELLPLVGSAAYHGNPMGFEADLHRGKPAPGSDPSLDAPMPLTDLKTIVAQAARQSPEGGVAHIAIMKPGRAGALIETALLGGDIFGRHGLPTLLFDGVTGRQIERSKHPRAWPMVVWNFAIATHIGGYAAPFLRWVMFGSGVLGSLMIASGLVMWLVARQRERANLGRTPRGHRLVEVLNVGVVAGMLVALAAYFWSNRLIPAELAGRDRLEIAAFFLAWLLALLHAVARPHRHAWIEQLCAAGVLTATLPVLNGLSGGRFAWQSFADGQMQVASFDCAALAVGLALLLVARKVSAHGSGSGSRTKLSARSTRATVN